MTTQQAKQVLSILEVTKCNICGRRNAQQLCSLPEFPVILRPLPCEVKLNLEAKKFPVTMPLRVGVCRHCGHMFLLLRPAEGILQELYDKLYTTYPSGLELGFATTDSDEFLRIFRQYVASRLPHAARILEIGCYDGYVLSHLAKVGFDVAGCDPSDGAAIAQENGLPIIRRFFSPDLFPPNYFDVVVNRHLIEHISDPVNFAAAAGKVCNRAGYIIIETPNGAYYLQRGLLEPFHLEHLSVFTPASLSSCIQQAGFRIEQMFSNARNLIAICVPRTGNNMISFQAASMTRLFSQAESFRRQLTQYLSDLASLVKRITQQGSTIAVWGAGGFGITILTLVDGLAESAVAIVDRDAKKHGLTFYNLDIRVMAPEYLVEHPVDYIIVCSQYGNEISRDIREKYNLRSAIVLISPKINFVR